MKRISGQNLFKELQLKINVKGGSEMEREKILKQVSDIIAEKLSIAVSEITENASFVDDLGADSLDTVELVMDFEEKFSLEIPDDDAEKIRTVKDAVDYIADKKSS